MHERNGARHGRPGAQFLVLLAIALTAWLVWAGAAMESRLSAASFPGRGVLSVVEIAILALLTAGFAARWARAHARRVLSEPPPRRRRLSRRG